jgi:hypothetical protein
MESSIRIQKYHYGLFPQISEILANEIGNQHITCHFVDKQNTSTSGFKSKFCLKYLIFVIILTAPVKIMVTFIL